MKRLILAVTCATLVMVHPASGAAYCRATSTAWGASIRVQLHDLLDENLRHADGTLWTRTELERSVRFVLADLNESAAADTPYVYLDTTSPAPSCTLDTNCGDSVWPWTACYTPNTIVVLPDCAGNETTALGGDPTVTTQHIVHLSRSLAPPAVGMRWTHGAWYLGANTFEMALLHELGHSLGLGHVTNIGFPWATTCVPNTTNAVNSVCPAGVGPLTGCAIMSSDAGAGFSASTFGLDDTAGLRGIYGLRSSPNTRSFEDSDLTSNSFYTLPVTSFWGISYFAASASPAAFRDTLSIGGYLRSSSEPGRRIISGWRWSDGTMSMVSTPPAGLPATGPIGVTETASSRIIAGHVVRNSADLRRYSRRLWADTTPLTSVAWTNFSTNPALNASDDVLTPGVSIAFDPGSGATLFAFRRDSAEVLLIGRLGAVWSQVVQTGVFSYTTPQIACSPQNCFMVTVRPGRPITLVFGVLDWREFLWFQTGNVGSYQAAGFVSGSGITAFGTPSVSVVARAALGYDFLVTQTQDADLTGGVFGSYTWAYRHTGGTSTMDVLAPAVASTPWGHAASTAAGDWIYAELFINHSP